MRNGKRLIRVQYRHIQWPTVNARNAGCTGGPWMGYLKGRGDVEFVDKDPDVVIFDVYSPECMKVEVDGSYTITLPDIPAGPVRILLSLEPVIVDMSKCDYAFAWRHREDINSPNYFRRPPTVQTNKGQDLVKPPNYNAHKIVKSKTKFCSFVYTHQVPFREEFCRLLSERKHVDCLGVRLNNVGGALPKIPWTEQEGRLLNQPAEIMSQYKFTFAFENTVQSGYVSEKIIEAMLADTIPIYWGHADVKRDFNPDSFINLRDYWRIDSAIDRILEIDSNPELHAQILANPWFHNNTPTKWFTGEINETLVEVFTEIANR